MERAFPTAALSHAPVRYHGRTLLTPFASSPSWRLSDELMYQNLLGPLGKVPSAWAESIFVDPVADVAILGRPDTCSA